MYRSRVISNILILISGLLFIGTLLYFIESTLLIINNSKSILFIFLNFLILIFESLTAIYGIFLLLHIAYIFKPEAAFNFPDNITVDPLVSIIIPTFNPNLYAVETNLLNLQNIAYKNIEIYFTDNSSDEELVSELQLLCAKFKVNFIHRDGIQGFKARNLNNVLTKIKGKYFFIIDIDQSIQADAIEKIIYLFETKAKKNKSLAFIQAQFEIKNANNIIRNSIAILYTFFYYVISFAKSSRGTVLFNGSSACFKTDIIKKINGFPEYSYTEDIEISYKLLLNGYNSIYTNINLSTALVPWEISDLISSFWRWTYGGTSVLRVNGLKILKSKKLSLDKKIELILNGFSFIAFSGILIIMGAILVLHWSNLSLIRPNLVILNYIIPLILVFPLIISLSHIISCIIGLVESKSLYRIPYLIPYSLASIAISFFIILPTFYALIGVKKPNSESSRWNRQFNFKSSVFALLIIQIISMVTFWDLFNNDNLLWISFASLSIVSALTIIFLFNDKKINTEIENYNYFKQFRKLHNFPESSKYAQN